MTGTTDFDPRTYWEARLSQDWNLRGVGARTLGRQFNAWAYRVRGEVFQRVAREALPDPAGARVLDVGSGTGFYVRCWQELGVGSVTAVDLTETAVRELRRRFPGVPVHQADISEGVAGLAPGSFHAASAMDVLFHIVDDERFARAIHNLHQLLAPGGALIWSDAFVRHRELRLAHQTCRRLADIERVLAGAGFQVERRVPMLVLMNAPADMRSHLPWLAWSAAFRLLSLAEPLGGLAGRALYPLESRLVRRLRESPTTEVMVCRKAS